MKTKIKTESQDQKDTVKTARKTLKNLQEGTDKENLAGRSIIDKTGKSLKSKPEPKRRKTEEITEDKSTQTEEAVITAEHLTSAEPDADYWQKLAEKRQEMLDDSFHENERLKDQVEALQEENKICKGLLDESRDLVEVLQEVIVEGEEEEESIEEHVES